MTDLDDLIRHHHGDTKKLREIRDTIRHDNFINTDDKNYIESLITMHLKNQPLDKPTSHKQPDTKIKLQPKSTTSSGPKSDSASNFSSNKKMGMLAGVVAVVAIIVIAGFTLTNQTDTTDSVIATTTDPLSVNVDQSTYQKADIISISGVSSSSAEPVELSIENTNGVKIWKETVNPKSSGQFSTLVIVGGGGWEDNGSYELMAETDRSVKDIGFRIVA